ncbi:DUF4157 domain-containing protein [Nostoc sp. UHCC 0251]|uniref:eCIS core domain-containing protein n=1 Tax=Nostoc sp. UHCC 0251 TaxID=3110240 RepID=UPI002B1FEB67|nr:DUF4157 domain-containing protein [Nostoc sp. UHCC 0251]MEA5621539.1 DUF4157 domain-containing protein [Nostoc sp. UHCC 0251]
MTNKRIAQTNQQRKSEVSQESGILQRAAVRSVAEAGVQSTEDKEAQPLGNSALSKDFSRVPISTTKPQQIMAKLMIGAVGDKYEQEADRVAAQVVQRINASTSMHSGEDETVQPEEMETKDKEARLMRLPILQRRSSDGGMATTPDLEASINRARGGGRPIENNVRKRMEQGFGADFSGARIHTDAQSDQLNRSIQARAFTTGQDVFFRQGAYQPGSRGGQELIAHELTHVVQQKANETRIQRKIGFEFEYINWRTAEASAAHFATATSTQPYANPNNPDWERIPKGKALVRGNGFELQADDHPTHGDQSDLEIVTDAFDEGISGRGQIRNAMHGIQNTLNHISTNFNRWWIQEHHLPRAIDILGIAVRRRSFLYPTGIPQWRAKPQTTIGLSLDKVADLLEDVFAAPAETPQEAIARRQGRMELTGWDTNVNPGRILQVQGGASAQAREAIGTYIGRNSNAPPLTQDLVGLLSLIIAYLRMADLSLVRSYPKTIAPVMARTDFGALFKMLSQPEQDWYKANSGEPFFELVKSAPWLTEMANTDEVFSHGVQERILEVGDAQGLTRGKWIKGIAKGKDYLTSKKFPNKAQRNDIEGLGAYGKKTDIVALPGGLTKQAAILELRAMPPIDVANIADVADRIWIYTYLSNRDGREKYGQVVALNF